MATFVGTGTQNAPQVGDKWINPDGSLNAQYVGGSVGWASAGYFVQPQPVQQPVNKNVIAYESATVGWDGANYVNPQTGAIYGPDPPTGFWRVTMDPKYSTSAATGSGTSTNAQATQGGNTGTSTQALNQDQINMALSLGYTQPTSMSSGQLARVNAAIADAAARTKAQQAATQSGTVLGDAPTLPGYTGTSSTNAQAQSSGNTTASGSTSTSTTNAAFDLSKFLSDNSTALMIAAAIAVGLMMLGGEEKRGRR